MSKGNEPCVKQDGVDDSARKLFGDILAGVAIAGAAYNAARAVKIATDEWLMAKKYWRIARNWLDYYKDYYAPVEDQELHEARNLKKETPEYDAARGRARAVAWLQFRDVVRQAMRCTSRYCTGLRQDMLADLSASQADAVAMADGLGYRNERAYIEARDDVRFKKMLETAKRGRDMVADNVSLSSAAAGIYGDLFNQSMAGLAGAGQYLGYWSSRNDTAYPTSYISHQRTRTGSGDGTQRKVREDGSVVEYNEAWQNTGTGKPHKSNIEERDL